MSPETFEVNLGVEVIRLTKKILCLKAAARICFSVRIWFGKIQTFIFFFLKLLFFFYFYYEKRRKFAVLEEFNPRLTKPFFVTRLTKGGGCYNPSLDFPNRTPYEIDFNINR